ncbi:MAG: C39 family peptidase, partial [Elusimicrobia bacterium]|nr:C39 family peptidase [Elusimicrobiota bacterium]
MRPRNALPVPIVRQSNNYTCGTAALLAVLYYWQVYDGNESGLLSVTDTTAAEGTPPKGIVKGAQKYGLAAYYKEMVTIDGLRTALGGGETVILDIQAWPDKPKEMPWVQRREDGHYVVLTAMDVEYAYFMDP